MKNWRQNQNKHKKNLQIALSHVSSIKQTHTIYCLINLRLCELVQGRDVLLIMKSALC